MAIQNSEVIQEYGIMIRSQDDWRNKGKFEGVISCAVTGRVLKSIEGCDNSQGAFEWAKSEARQFFT